MDKLVFRAISAENEIELFLEKFEMFVGIRLPTQYAVGNKVIGVFIKNNVVGGYMIVVK